jgi:NADH:ubiquinone oxidoreductase subunit C
LNIPEENIQVVRARRVSCQAPSGRFEEIFNILTKDMGFVVLCAITGLDEGDKLSAVYHISRQDGLVLNLKNSVDKSDPVIKTVTAVFPSAEVYERELVDLLGFKVEGLPAGNRYPLTDDWPLDEHPLRKDWQQKGSS